MIAVASGNASNHSILPGTGPIKILQPKFYATLFFKNFDWMIKI